MARTPDYFRGKSIMITGAGSGVGRSAAQIFAREGAAVACLDIDVEGANNTVASIVANGGKAIAIECDVRDRLAIRSSVKRSIDEFGRIDFQFNNAGSAGRRSPFLDIDDELWDWTFDLNSKGVFYGMQEVLPHMLDNGKGVIVNMASMSHKRGGPGQSVHYSAAKAAVLTMTLGVAREFASRGIRALSISPGPIATNFHNASSTSPELRKTFLSDVPMGRMAHPDEIGELVLFLCSDACEFMTADTVYVNGGGGFR